MHLTTSEFPAPFWGVIMKSNGNGTYFGISIEHVNRDDRGYVDFEKMIGLDGIALINVVSNPGEATMTGAKDLKTQITHNDGRSAFALYLLDLSDCLSSGGTWKPLTPPKVDSLGQAYGCTSTVRLQASTSPTIASLLC